MMKTSVAQKNRFIAVSAEGEACVEISGEARAKINEFYPPCYEEIECVYNCHDEATAKKLTEYLICSGFTKGGHADNILEWFFEEGYGKDIEESDASQEPFVYRDEKLSMLGGVYQIYLVNREGSLSNLDACGNRIDIILVPCDRKEEFLESKKGKELIQSASGHVLFYM